MTSRTRLEFQINKVYTECVEDVMNAPQANIFEVSEDCKSLLMIMKNFIETNEIENIEDFKILLNAPFLNRITALKDFRKRKQQIIDEECKREILEKSASDIMFDVERLTDEERAQFEFRYGEMTRQMMEEIARLPPLDGSEPGYAYKINYRIFDFEAVYKLRVDMMKYLRERDMKWVPNLMQ